MPKGKPNPVRITKRDVALLNRLYEGPGPDTIEWKDALRLIVQFRKRAQSQAVDLAMARLRIRDARADAKLARDLADNFG